VPAVRATGEKLKKKIRNQGKVEGLVKYLTSVNLNHGLCCEMAAINLFEGS
jgi:hypothetical protein